ncbi:MAG TPA: cytoplasmic filament protein CfpA [Spirochaetota bacterium]|nr:cytoplasmic filament protein CfpA [Spirochaetota bacterium]OPZ39419.1 MAG: Cytoplasmic filament protein A [Spirochaetes bacterium ADurb.BinA120]HNU90513.1 cytoplasmic filament protein CfpA [Spirochaetota bacterium]HPV96493.1 cytoplasmic filament protein CfpA [Spirochaetota bacterium]
MSITQLPKSPNKFHPTEPSAVGSRNSIAQEGRDKIAESKLLIDEASDKVLNTIMTKLPEEVLAKLDVMGGLKEKIYNYVNQSYVNMANRYTVTMEDEFIKKVRDFVDKEEAKGLARYTSREVVELLDKIGGADKFNTGEIEKSMVNMYGHLQGHIQRGMNDLENETNAILRQKTDVGAFVRGENAYAIIKCIFKDNQLRPKYVYDVKLSINILDSELVSPIYHYQVTVESLLKDAIQKHIQDLIEKQVMILTEELVDQGKSELSGSEIMFEKIKRIENFTDDDKEDEKSRRYTILAKKFLDKIEGLRAEIDVEEYDPLNIRENIKHIIDSENIRNRGYNTAINALTSILDTSKLGYQVCDNMKNARICQIREYEELDRTILPDERYAIRLAYYDQNQLREEKREFDRQMEAFTREILRAWDVVHAHYESKKRFRSLKDFDDLCNRLMSKEWRRGKKEEEADPNNVLWNEIGEMYNEGSFVEKNNRTYEDRILNLKNKLKYLREILQNMHGYQNPIERVILDERLSFLDRKFNEFTYKINPHHIQPGLILDVDVTTIKRKQYMLKGMANVLNEFLYGISKGFADAAFAQFKRRRSTVREDISQSFGEQEMKEDIFEAAYKSASGSGESSEVKGSIDLSPRAKPKGKASGLKEL